LAESNKFFKNQLANSEVKGPTLRKNTLSKGPSLIGEEDSEKKSKFYCKLE
jgi:hypothetical protein